MRTVKWNAFLSGLCGFAVALGMVATSARADVVTEKGASILIFPEVLATNNRDTIIQIANTGNSMVHARCFYTDAQLPPGCDREAPLIGCTPVWQTTDFTIWLTRQQPTHWRVSTGRPVDPTDDFDINSDGAGFDPGLVPPVNPGFTGELKCVEVTVDGFPIGGNHLIGLVTIKDTAGANLGDVRKYNAIGIQGTENVGGTGNALQLNNPRGTTDGQYNACPQTLILNHFASDADVVVQGATLEVGEVTLTLVPCSQDYERGIPGSVTVQFQVFNEFEERFSASTTVTCWKSTDMEFIDSPSDSTENSVFNTNILGSVTAQTRITPADDLDGAVVAVVSTDLENSGTARIENNIHTEGDRFFGTDGGAFDEIIMSDEF
jgi:hypothetical protein